MEFIIIFLAVSLGFFAESLRQNITDEAKEKEYMQILVQNLKDDTTTIGTVVHENELQMTKLKMLMSFSFKNLAIRRQENYCSLAL